MLLPRFLDYYCAILHPGVVSCSVWERIFIGVDAFNPPFEMRGTKTPIEMQFDDASSKCMVVRGAPAVLACRC